jgi:hypothetical protein
MKKKNTKSNASKRGIKILVSTNQTQGQRNNDFCHVPNGEIVIIDEPCDTGLQNIDGSCDCARCVTGIQSRCSTTTFQVALVNITKSELVDKFALLKKSFEKFCSKEEVREIATIRVDITLEIADYFPVGAILERRGGDYIMRQ